jgi:copper chaperone CopZ
VETRTFTVPNIGCNGCIRTIQNEVGTLKGVTQVTGDLNSRQVTVEWQAPTTWEDIKETLEAIEYPPVEA